MSQRRHRKNRKPSGAGPSPIEPEAAPAPRRQAWRPVFSWGLAILAMYTAWSISTWFRADWCRVHANAVTVAKADTADAQAAFTAADNAAKAAEAQARKIAGDANQTKEEKAAVGLRLIADNAKTALTETQAAEAAAAAALGRIQWEGRFLPTTHDSYFFASAIKHGATNDPETLRDHPSVADYGALTLLGERATAWFDVDVADVVTYMPVYLGGLVAIPIVLIGRKYGSLAWGFGAACLAGMGYSYFNRTVAGYFDTDLFSIFVPALALYCLLTAHRDSCRGHLYFGALLLFGFQFTYPSGAPISIALGIGYLGFRTAWSTWQHKMANAVNPGPQWPFTAESALIISVGLFCCNYTNPNLTAINPVPAIASLFVIANIFAFTTWFRKKLYSEHPRILYIAAAAALVALVFFGEPFQQIRNKTLQYLPQAITKKNSQPASATPQYMNVMKTIVEARGTPMFPKVEKPPPGAPELPWSAELLGYQHGHTVAERVSGSKTGFLLALAGYIILVIIYPEFIIALPFIGIGIFAHWGGHRFTIHMVPIAALSLVFLPFGILELARRIYKSLHIEAPKRAELNLGSFEKLKKHGRWSWAVLGTRVAAILLAALFLVPNLQMAKARSATLNTVLVAEEVQLIDEIRKNSKPGDYVHTWWDWGTAVWYHARRNVLTHPGNQSSDTYVCAKMLMTDSARLSAHLGRVAVEYYHHANPNAPNSRGRLAVNYIFDFKKEGPNQSLKSLEEHLPVRPTRDVFLFLPYRLVNFYEVLHNFSERNLVSGKVKPFPQFVRFNAWQRQGDEMFLGLGRDKKQDFFVDLKQMTLTNLRRGLPPQGMRDLVEKGKNPFPGAGVLTLRLKSGPWVHGRQIQITKDGFVIKLLNGNPVPIPLKMIGTVYPSHQIKSVEQLNIQTHTIEGPLAKKPGLHIIVTQNPPLAVLADDTAYQSMLVQMLILGRPDPKYFEQIAANGTGRVFKLKQ